MSELVSIVMPVYNVAAYLEKAVQSVLAQTYVNFELILVDDGSTDQSGAMCDEFAQQDRRIQVVHQANAGLSGARNRGIESATGSYLIFLDSDDYIAPNMLEVLVTQLEKEQADVSSCNIVNVYTNRQTPQFDQADFYQVMDQTTFLENYLIGQKVPGSMCNKLLRRSVVADLRFIPGKTYEDAFYHLELIQRAKRYVVCGQALYYYYHRGDSLTTKPFSERAMDCVEVYTQFHQLITAQYPNLAKAADFRLAYAYFTAFDRLLVTPNYQARLEYSVLKNYLQEHAIAIAGNDYFRTGRRIASLALKCSVRAYRYLLVKDIEKNKGIH